MVQHFSETSPLVLVGCGHMGRAMAQGWLRAGVPADHLYIVDPQAAPESLPGSKADHFVASAGFLPKGMKARAIVMAVKPQIMNDALPLMAPFIGDGTVVLSVAAGVTLDQMARGTGGKGTCVRVMPNTPAAIGQGISGLTAGSGISEDDRALALELMGATGEAVWIEREDQMDAVTGVSGSGPAYVFYMVECLAAAGVREGLPEDTAMALARQTVIGAGHLMDAETDVEAAELRRRVTSPGGTTAAALNVLMRADGLGQLMSDAVSAARKRGAELAG
ncbi:pyrroline-5-carboxylate reductase [Kordiimonas lacus]|uniref:Pyrroline-5-carboxylate reductase n=1 Tax=Kordiimonas lacus TaxID=637679 RepID=A0A1G7EZP4_9PROT|nr:pyrroline-5-carboxylate reductase [Kordiimonas lacus]SDE69139.1 pyrroline-5-carboxylate reductase [Kordiimonas lacus]